MKQQNDQDNEDREQSQQTQNLVKIDVIDDLLIIIGLTQENFKNIPLSITHHIISIVNDDSTIKASMKENYTEFAVVTSPIQRKNIEHIKQNLSAFIEQLNNLCQTSSLEEFSNLAMLRQHVQNLLRTYKFNTD